MLLVYLCLCYFMGNKFGIFHITSESRELGTMETAITVTDGFVFSTTFSGTGIVTTRSNTLK